MFTFHLEPVTLDGQLTALVSTGKWQRPGDRGHPPGHAAHNLLYQLIVHRDGILTLSVLDPSNPEHLVTTVVARKAAKRSTLSFWQQYGTSIMLFGALAANGGMRVWLRSRNAAMSAQRSVNQRARAQRAGGRPAQPAWLVQLPPQPVRQYLETLEVEQWVPLTVTLEKARR